MLRFTNAVVTSVAHRTIATSAMLFGSQACSVASAGGQEAPVVGLQDPKLHTASVWLEGRHQQLRIQIEEVKLRCEKLEGRCAGLEPSYLLLVAARALQEVDEHFQHLFKIRCSLLAIWQTPKERRDENSRRAMQDFLQQSEPWLPKDLRLKFFAAWDHIARSIDFPLPHDKPQLQRCDVALAMNMCCHWMGDDVCDALVEAALHFGEVGE